MSSRLSDHAATRNSRPRLPGKSLRGKVSSKAGGRGDDVLHETSWRYKDLEKILSIYSQEDVRLAGGFSSRGQGGYNP
nr:hypothetical protein [uncultured Acetobacter sp.]